MVKVSSSGYQDIIVCSFLAEEERLLYNLISESQRGFLVAVESLLDTSVWVATLY